MNLDVAKLEDVRQLPGGVVQARCPACAEAGHDRSGEHLRVFPDGAFGCCVHPKDKNHRRRIFALVGTRREVGKFTVRVIEPRHDMTRSRSIKEWLQPSGGTLGTGKTETEMAVPSLPGSISLSGTLGTGMFKLRAHQGEIGATPEKGATPVSGIVVSRLDLKRSVPSVPNLPYFTPGGTLVIPFDSPTRFHWWNGGQSIKQTHSELLQKVRKLLQQVRMLEETQST